MHGSPGSPAFTAAFTAALSAARWLRAPALVLSLSLAGCSSLLSPASPPPAVYALAHPMRQTAARAIGSALPVLVVHVPQAAAGYGSARMIYTQQPSRLQAFARHEWVDTPARMLAPLLVAALEGGGRFSAVVLSPSAATGSLQLETQLLLLQQEFGTPPSRVRLVLRAQLIDSANRQVLATRAFEQSASSASEDAPGGVAAAQVAVSAVLADLAAWCQAVVPPQR